jgi:hypothetical protein
VQVSVRHFVRCDAETVFRELYLDAGYVRRLHLEVLGSEAVEALEQRRGPDGLVHRRLRVRHPVAAPFPLSRLLGSCLLFDEDGVLDEDARVWRFQVYCEGLGDRLALAGVVRVEPAFGGSERVLAVDVSASVYGMASLIERHVAREVRRNAALAAGFASRVLHERGLIA